MSKLMYRSRLRFAPGRSGVVRRAFSLAELIVSMGILVLMLTLAGQVMNFTTEATGQARALTEINQSLRVFEQTLREDLRYIQPGDSLILIQGNPINAYWTQSGREGDVDGDPANGYPHVRDPERENPADSTLLNPPRADMLMFFTHRQAGNYVQYEYRDATPGMRQPVTSGVQQVVYGHADVINFSRNGAHAADDPFGYDLIAEFPSEPTTVFPVPAARWHLARRVIHLLPLQSDPPPFAVGSPPWGSATDNILEGDDEYDGTDEADLLGNHAFLTGKTDVLSAFNYEEWVLTPSDGPSGRFPFYWPKIFDHPDFPPFARSRIDPVPPPLIADRLGHYFLPHCASFKVEWALNPSDDFVGGRLDGERELYWCDPGAVDPLAQIENVILDPATEATRADTLEELVSLPLLGEIEWVPNSSGGWDVFDEQYSLRSRFGGGTHFSVDPWHAHDFGDEERPNLVVFTANRRQPAPRGEVGELIPEDVFPVALRITVDMYDDEARLDRPIRHVIVVPVGG